MVPTPPAKSSQSLPDEIDLSSWFAFIAGAWEQGEHVAIIGPTGSGKTTIAQYLLEIRGYVVVLAVKRHDETLDRFRGGPRYGLSKYHVIQRWPPNFNQHRVILWLKPKSVDISAEQKRRLHIAINQIYLAGGWTVFWDDAGYISAFLSQATPLGIMLNQGRSDHLSNVVAMTQPKSMAARLPSETFKQCRHMLAFKFDNEGEVKAIAEIMGIDWHSLRAWLAACGPHDFVYKGKGRIFLVRNRLTSQ